MNKKFFSLVSIIALSLSLTSCNNDNIEPESNSISSIIEDRDYSLGEYEVVSEIKRDPYVFTQGLEYMPNGNILESSGQYGQSFIRILTPEGKEAVRENNDPSVFAEGATLIKGNKIAQLTWKNKKGYLRDPKTLKTLNTFMYSTEGWGLCYDNNMDVVWRSDGTDTITAHNPDSMQEFSTFEVTAYQDGKPIKVTGINELECVGDYVYANVFTRNEILKISTKNWIVEKVYDMTPLVNEVDERLHLNREQVLNGIAYDKKEKDFLITGKMWDVGYKVKLD